MMLPWTLYKHSKAVVLARSRCQQSVVVILLVALALTASGAVAAEVSKVTMSSTGDAARLLERGRAKLAAGQPEPARKVLEKGRDAFRDLNDRTGEAEAELSIGEAWEALVDPSRAIVHYRRAYDAFEVLQQPSRAVAALSSLARAELVSGFTTRALATFDRGLAIARELHDMDMERELLRAKLAGSVLGDPTVQAAAAERLLAIARETGDEELAAEASPQLEMARLLGDSSVAAPGLAEVDDFLGSLQAGLEGIALRNLAWAYLEEGDAVNARQYLDEALRLARIGGDVEGVGVCLQYLGALSFHLGDFQGAVDIYRQLLAEAEEHQQKDRIARAAQLLATSLLFVGKITDAEAELERAHVLATQLAEPGLLNEIQQGLGLAAFAHKDYERAATIWQQQIQEQTQEPGANVLLAAYTLGMLARAQAMTDQIDSARGTARSFLEIVGRSGAAEDLSTAYETLGFVEFRARRWQKAEGLLRQSIAQYEQIRRALGQAELLKVSIQDYQSIPYDLLQEVLVEQGKFAEALEVAERSRAQTFAEALARHRGDGFEQPPALDFAAIQTLARQSGATFLVYSILYDPTAFLTSNRTGGGQPGLEHKLNIWVIEASGVLTFAALDLTGLLEPLEGRSLTEKIGLLFEGLESRRGNRVAESRGGRRLPIGAELSADASLRELHELLIVPIVDKLPKRPQDRLVVVPQGPLFSVPFAALLDQQEIPLVERHTLTLAPSLAVFAALSSERVHHSWRAEEVLAVGNPTLAADFAHLGDLPGAANEALAIAERFAARPLLGDAASKSAVRQRLASSRLIHFATHGLLEYEVDLDLPGALVLAPDATSNGLLTAGEIAALPLAADLVVLSACDTGGGRITGDGVLGLARSFLSAGAASLVASLWQVDDKATDFLMQELYEHLRDNDPAAALTRAMRATRQKYPHPGDWAAFVAVARGK